MERTSWTEISPRGKEEGDGCGVYDCFLDIKFKELCKQLCDVQMTTP